MVRLFIVAALFAPLSIVYAWPLARNEAGGQQIADDAAGGGLYLYSHCHAGGEVDGPVLDLHVGARQRDACGVDQLLSRGLARIIVRFVLLLAGLTVLLRRLVMRNGVGRNPLHLTADKVVTVEIESDDFDLCVPTGAHNDTSTHNAIFQGLLGRGPSGAELSNLVSALNSGQSPALRRRRWPRARNREPIGAVSILTQGM